ncbi:MAG: twin-arginine translocase TatA/TatE family subunit [Bacteroidetes bacterium]|nr:twin-arginine translocase TatA/TatE family subunit [Bacteroidota bacterium]
MGVILFISGPELFVIVVVVLLLFGANKMPDLAKGLGKGMREFRRAADEIRREIETSTSEIRKDINEVNDEMKKDLNS